MTNYKATPEQWEVQEKFAPESEDAACLLELRARVERLELGAGIRDAVAEEVQRMFSMPIPDRWYWIKKSDDGEWFPAYYDKLVGWTNGDCWEDWDKTVTQWHLIPFPLLEPEQSTSWRDLCAELTNQLADLMHNYIHIDTERAAETLEGAMARLAYDSKCFELIQKARIALEQIDG